MAFKFSCAVLTALLFSVGASAAVKSRTPASTAASTSAPAPATATTTTTAPKTANDLKTAVEGKLRIGFSVNAATKMDGVTFKDNGATVATGDASVENTPALELTWASKLYHGPDSSKFDWFAGLTLERERSISSMNMKRAGSATPAQTFKLEPDRPVFHANLISGGIRWTPNAMVYVPIGFTFGFRSEASGGKSTNFNLDPKVGLLAGAGLRVSPNFEIEAVYKVIRYDFTLRETTFVPGGQEFVGSAEMAGLSAGARYIF